MGQRGRIGLYTGSFDRVTIGHVVIMSRALAFVDRLSVAVGRNATKATMLSPDARQDLLKRVAEEELQTDKIKAASFSGLTIDFAKEHGVSVLVRGLRNSSDMDFEAGMAGMNHVMHSELETIFLLARPAHVFITATLVRQIYQMGGDISPFVPPCVLEALGR